MVISNFKNIFKFLVVAVFLGMLSLYFFWDPSHVAIFPKCPFHELTGIYCPGCGSQRAVHDIINGEVIDGFRHNYLIIMVIMILGYQGYVLFSQHILKKTVENLLHKSKITNTILVLVIMFWILRNINIFPFTELAP